MPTEIVSNHIPCQIEPWIGPEGDEVAFFNATLAKVNGHTVLLGRIVVEETLPGQVDMSPFLGVVVENGGGYAERVKIIDLSPWRRKLRVINIEDFRLGEVDENGSALAGINVVVGTRKGDPSPFPGIAVIRNLHRPDDIEIEEMFVLKEEEGKNTLITSKASNPLVEGFYRPDGEKFNHVFAHFTYNRATEEQTVSYEYIEHPPKYGRERMGLTGLPIELPTQPGEESRQLFIVHGSRPRSYISFEYGIGRAVRIVDKEGKVRWIAEKNALLLPVEVNRPRFFDKRPLYSTGHVTQVDENGDAWLIIAASYNDEAVAKVTYSKEEVIKQPIDPVSTRVPNAA
ncbi:hypothetical protein A3B45_04120 [Candidatus Daviesbacteria bacterium RIFCSPLOWO2_01_FULL_39_12]|uniref:Uncharacterized protein n=1 Tax=Candidatus Daviesbacteria bacterium RIFCSPLOWO2_01_FULL_39_12 TaxID=1797785 RepID=A0A1F5KSF5_9BACT|nr:MAG: hypothetical protein A3D79_01050 [Candidatus Daviesbacteria bacterium RIFCSPHIGHO2_02_FULL_39_8]OGE43764.1 MAG: hypothetical protein A3B45_04120 [Candidatus Daviesbacteria bacterium RIFCSPLOWO2_01_FULL_39_12]